MWFSTKITWRVKHILPKALFKASHRRNEWSWTKYDLIYVHDLDTWESKTLSNLEALSMKMNIIPCFVQEQLDKTWICAAELLQRGTYKGWVSPVCGHSYTPACGGSWAHNALYLFIDQRFMLLTCSQALDNLHSTSWGKSNTNPSNTDKICVIIFRFDNHWC